MLSGSTEGEFYFRVLSDSSLMSIREEGGKFSL